MHDVLGIVSTKQLLTQKIKGNEANLAAHLQPAVFVPETLNGMDLMWLLGHLPQTGGKAIWEGWKLEVVDLDGKRVDKVLAMKLPEATDLQKGEHSDNAAAN